MMGTSCVLCGYLCGQIFRRDFPARVEYNLQEVNSTTGLSWVYTVGILIVYIKEVYGGMGKASKAMVTAFLTGLLLVMMTLPASAAPPSYDAMACWNNCGIGGTDAKNY